MQYLRRNHHNVDKDIAKDHADTDNRPENINDETFCWQVINEEYEILEFLGQGSYG